MSDAHCLPPFELQECSEGAEASSCTRAFARELGQYNRPQKYEAGIHGRNAEYEAI